LEGGVLKQHTILVDIRETIERTYFPCDAVMSLMVPLSSGEVIEAAMVGHDGAVGAGAMLSGRVSLNRAVVQLEGGCQSCDVNALRAILGQCSILHVLPARHEQVLFAHAQQSAACNISHPLDSRMACWLLRARDLSGSDQLNLTQEYLGQMPGVRRPSASLSAQRLQQAGLLSFRRGHIQITNVDGLKEVSCDCYEAVKLHYDTLHTTLMTSA
jgi:hypothetical protein